ncbi:uncharacterized protein LOC132791635 isoform X2 [Drosophila nasuta]|uniref:uncharacterized protein LOC132791635 isoform X2 n=1 Tax=Drosophila nasuta TaxID=42062 RepID=UPI00295F037E|nr:uncharacterized protein LOC132791635 isoform X2 [Drosophila nasuta]
MQSGFLLFIFLTLLCICHGNEKCYEIHSVTQSELESMPRNTILDSLPLKIKCFLKCLMDDILGVDGRIDLSRIDGNEELEPRRNKLEKCKERYDSYIINNADEACDYAVKVLQCLRVTKN